MGLAPGSRVGHYAVTSLLGEGGMGQVWQATDTQLNRQVALKILPDAFASDPDRLARFTREAQILARLNHPNIAQIHGIEEAEGTRALVLELVEGPTLADRIKQGPIPLDEALPIAKQICVLRPASRFRSLWPELRHARTPARPPRRWCQNGVRSSTRAMVCSRFGRRARPWRKCWRTLPAKLA